MVIYWRWVKGAEWVRTAATRSPAAAPTAAPSQPPVSCSSLALGSVAVRKIGRKRGGLRWRNSGRRLKGSEAAIFIREAPVAPMDLCYGVQLCL